MDRLKSSAHRDYKLHEHNRNETDPSVDYISEYVSDYKSTLDPAMPESIKKQSNISSFYTLQPYTLDSHLLFPIPGHKSADALRQSLRNHLPPRLVTNQYGDNQPFNNISNAHLPNLQAKLWQELPRQRAANNSKTNLHIETQEAGHTTGSRDQLIPPGVSCNEAKLVSAINAPVFEHRLRRFWNELFAT